MGTVAPESNVLLDVVLPDGSYAVLFLPPPQVGDEVHYRGVRFWVKRVHRLSHLSPFHSRVWLTTPPAVSAAPASG
ncbi:hypothetical protein R5W23_003642 [Gemmata sp. JC673]|uniref:DUF4469 domain-containing protein n=1 Tax=Gemmata algarum TaxID=2975278 RepID=A0ABU5F4X3_9BACT|nr:hypothetical protein [Gemmata algarum]MDY3562193.1 hypothetical protein [Gemmata algarum]